MGFLDYSNATQSNIIPKEEFEALVQEVFDTISTNISKSLGPLGSSATILDGMMTEATKDGYSILKNYRFHNRYKRMIYNLIMTPCTKMNNSVGDGTTTAIALTAAMFKNYRAKKGTISSLYRLPREFNRAWDTIISSIVDEIEKRAVAITEDDYDKIHQLAYVTSNGNEDISEQITNIYRETMTPCIKQKDSPTNESYVVSVDGFEFPTNMISDAYVKNQDLSATEDNAAVMIFDHKIETDFFMSVIKKINDVMRSMGKKLVIVAPYYDAYMCDTVLDQYLNWEFKSYGSLNLILTQYDIGKLPENQLHDLAVVTKSKVITQDLAMALKGVIEERNCDRVVEDVMEKNDYEFYRLIGSADSVLLSCNTGAIFKMNNIEEDSTYIETLRRAEKDLQDVIDSTSEERQSYSAKIFDASSRLMRLKMKNYIYYVGADSLLQKQIIWDSVEDVIKCVKSAIKYGTVPGCQITIASICIDMINELTKDAQRTEEGKVILNEKDLLKYNILDIICTSVMDVYAKVLHGPDGDGIIKTIESWDKVGEDELEKMVDVAIQKGNDIIRESIMKNQTYDIESLEFVDSIITSAQTDMMVLISASELVKILISGNQCIFLDSDVNESHQETKEVYV